MLPVADPRGRPHRPNVFSISRIFFGKFGKNYMAPPLEGWRPSKETMDLPLVTGTRSQQERLSKLELGSCCQRLMKLVNIMLAEHIICLLSSVDRHVI